MSFNELALIDKAEERQKRETKAASAECTPVSIDVENQTGVFSGSSGVYNTWLDECECVDYKRRLAPCKHMYRLAYELGVYRLKDVATDSSKIKRKITPKERTEAFEKNVALIETYPYETQRELQSALSDRYGNMVHVCSDISLLEKPLSDDLLELLNNPKEIVERNTQKQTVDGMLAAGFSFPEDLKTTKKARYEWCLNHADTACAYVYPEWCVVRPVGTLEIAYMKTYTYLNRKFKNVLEVEW